MNDKTPASRQLLNMDDLHEDGRPKWIGAQARGPHPAPKQPNMDKQQGSFDGLTASNLVAMRKGINSRFIKLRDRGAIINAIWRRLKDVEAELRRRYIRW